MWKSLLVKIAARVAAGMFFKDRPLDVRGVRTVLVNRTDRLGDAIITLPLILALKKHFEVTVLTSRYNDAILKPFVDTLVFVDAPPTLAGALAMAVTGRAPAGLSAQERLPAPQYDLYLDFIGIRGLHVTAAVRRRGMCRRYVTLNCAWWGWAMEYARPGSLELDPDRPQIIEAYVEYVRRALGIALEVDDYADCTPLMTEAPSLKPATPYLLVNVAGADRFHGPDAAFYARLINGVSFDGTIVVMDELGRPNLAQCRALITRPGVRFLDEDHAVGELLWLAQGAAAYVGADSGITQLLQAPTNALLLFAGTNVSLWKPYSRNPYRVHAAAGVIVEDTRTMHGARKKIIYAPCWCRPCFDYGCSRPRCMRGLAKAQDAIVQELTEFIRENRH